MKKILLSIIFILLLSGCTHTVENASSVCESNAPPLCSSAAENNRVSSAPENAYTPSDINSLTDSSPINSSAYSESNPSKAEETDKHTVSSHPDQNNSYTNSGSAASGIQLSHTHTYQTKVIAHTCTEQGYTVYTCSACGNTFKDNHTAANGHSIDYSSYTVVREATESETGLARYTCSACDYFEEKVIPMKVLLVRDAAVDQIEDAVFRFINEFRISQGSPETTKLLRLTEICECRAELLHQDFSHSNEVTKNLLTRFQYGERREETILNLETGEVSSTGQYYYQLDGAMEAIGYNDIEPSDTLDEWAKEMAAAFRNSESHWSYVGAAKYLYMAVGVAKQSDRAYVCVYVAETDKYE